MKYHVCALNCLEDWYCEDTQSIAFDTKDEAILFANHQKEFFPPFDVSGKIKWYFPSCGSDGLLHNPSPEDDQLECYQLINVIPSEE